MINDNVQIISFIVIHYYACQSTQEYWTFVTALQIQDEHVLLSDNTTNQYTLQHMQYDGQKVNEIIILWHKPKCAIHQSSFGTMVRANAGAKEKITLL